jgi:DNA-binding beta-propeller fold protein YncE
MKRITLGLGVLAVWLAGCAQNGGSTLPSSGSSSLYRGTFERRALSHEAKTSAKLYVSDPISNKVEIYDVAGHSQQPIGSITEDISGPGGMAADSAGNVYVANTIGNTVTEYHSNGSGPVATYSQDVLGPVDVAVDSSGNVYVANFFMFDWSLLEFPAGSTTPSQEIRDSPGSAYSVGLALDAKDTLYASFQNFYSQPSVYDYAPGLKSPTAVIPTGSACSTQLRCILGGLLVDKSGNLLAADGTLPGIEVFPPGKTSPSTVFGKTGSPQSMAFASDESDVFVADTAHHAVEEYTYPGGTLVNTISAGLKSVYGVAVSPPSSQ